MELLTTQLHVSRKELDLHSNIFNPVKNGMLPNKPYGGLWTSTFTDYHKGSEWVELLLEKEFIETTNELHSWLITPNSNAKIYKIDTLKDMYRLYDDYSYNIPNRYRGIDFEKLSRDYNAIHLTAQGQWKTTGFSFDSDFDPLRPFGENFYGWDCESTLWLHWDFHVKYIGKRSYQKEKIKC